MPSLAKLDPDIVLYHASPRINQASIGDHGVDPVYSQGKTARSWWTRQGMIFWALSHAACKRELLVCAFDIWRAVVPRAKVHGTRWPGVYYSYFVIRPESCWAADLVLTQPELLIHDNMYSGDVLIAPYE
jgi:hypothetical protein